MNAFVRPSIRPSDTKSLRPKMDGKFWARYFYFSLGIVLQDKFFGLELFSLLGFGSSGCLSARHTNI